MMRKALEVFEQGNKNKSREAIVIPEKENGYLDSGDSIRDEWLDFWYILKIALRQDWLMN